MAGLTIHRAQTHLLHPLPRAPYWSLHPWVVSTNIRPEAGSSQLTRVLCMVLTGCRVVSQRRCNDNPSTHVPEYPANRPTETQVAAAGREPMVPQTVRIQPALLDHRTHRIALCQLLQRRAVYGQTGGCSSDTLHASWWNHRARHALVHAAHVHHGACEDPAAELRDLLVHASPVHPVLLGDVYSCDWMFRERFCGSL